MLGKLYRPKGLALETARQVLECENVYACNVAWGCSNGCLYCYGPFIGKQDREKWLKIRHPKDFPVNLVKKQLESEKFDKKPEGVFISFMTDPLLPELYTPTTSLLSLLHFGYCVPVATLSKVALSYWSFVRHGLTIVSSDYKFWRKWEPNTLRPKERIKLLRWRHDDYREYVWISMEPYPPSAIWRQKLEVLLEELKFVKFIIFGKWNYDKRAGTEEAKKEYIENVFTFRDFCKNNGIRYHVKSDTLKFCGLEEEFK